MAGYNYYIDYAPRYAGNVAIGAIYFVLLVANITLGFLARDKFFPLSFVIGCILEYMGFVGRCMGHFIPTEISWFMVQSIGITIAPIFFMAGIYNSFGEMIVIFGESHSVLKPNTYKKVFIVSDVISLICQSAGGGIAAYLASAGSASQAGNYLMLAALAFQVFSMTIYIFLTLLFFFRVCQTVQSGRCLPSEYAHMRQNRMFKMYVVAMFVSTLFIYIRCIYRVAEMSHGVDGPLTRNEIWFLVFDASMVIAGVSTLTTFYPGAALGKGAFSGIVYHNVRENGSDTCPLKLDGVKNEKRAMAC
ncbi:hypothetical protein HII12_002201 [Brettanomyces bruxellensis]|uniref:Sphingoid long-chain base transporter RSB1 n=1 Tax=Dekkera bruxellensis TaxID=5007 RepID=A0A8H6BJR2_DEKBR|nr:hypothetical protein HII12_002201 [Brettanomyces bruxellensis]